MLNYWVWSKIPRTGLILRLIFLPQEYIHRVGRTARGIDGRGHALLILRPEELGFLRFLKQAKVSWPPAWSFQLYEHIQTFKQDLPLNFYITYSFIVTVEGFVSKSSHCAVVSHRALIWGPPVLMFLMEKIGHANEKIFIDTDCPFFVLISFL